MRFETGSLVSARGREWIVQGESSEDLLVLRPVGGTEHETCGIYLPLELEVKLSQFSLPNPDDLGDFNSAQLLRDAVRLTFRSTAGPFRSFGKIAVQPRPYQLVPLIVALRNDPVRILIADDVGIGKTIESCLVAKELLERREVNGLAVLCPPHLAQQWHDELLEKFNIEAEVVLPSTIRKLEKNQSYNESIFDIYPNVIVSIDFIKSDRRKDDFLRACPKLVIVDEAHSCAFDGKVSSAQHKRHDLLRRLTQDQDRHVLLVTATPHSGKEDSFRSLLRLLSDSFSDLPANLGGEHNQKNRALVAAHFVQRRRPDIEKYLGTNTHFPERKVREEPYILSHGYKKLFTRVLKFCSELVQEPGQSVIRQRVRWWAALGLLRALSSSPEAAIATLRSRGSAGETTQEDDADEIGRREVLDVDDLDESVSDQTPGADIGEEASSSTLSDFARAAEKLRSAAQDTKLAKVEEVVKELLKDGFCPVVFARFVKTAPYVAQHLAKALGNRVQVKCVTGEQTPAEREEIIQSFDPEKPRVLVATDCISEGINLQEFFNAVIHYDLAWNPTRHEQREGRVDRFGQTSKEVRVVTIYGTDNQIDGVVLDVLLRKQRSIRNDLGIAIPIPVDADSVVEAIFEGLLLRSDSGHSTAQQSLPGFDEYFKPKKDDLHKKWDDAREREKSSRAMFAQHAVKVEDVAREIDAVEAATGSSRLPEFVQQAAKRNGGYLREKGAGYFDLDLKEAPLALRDLLPDPRRYLITFDPERKKSATLLGRTHPVVESLSTFVFNSALDPFSEGVARRCGVIRTSSVKTRTTLLLLRLRFQISFTLDGKENSILAEQCGNLVFEGAPESPNWIPDTELLQGLYQAEPIQNVSPHQAKEFIGKVLAGWDALAEKVQQYAEGEAATLLESHSRVRKTLSEKLGRSLKVEALSPDVLGIYIYLPPVANS